MEEFYIDVELSLGVTRIQVDEVPSEEWDMPFTPQFIIEFHHPNGFTTLTLQLHQGTWHDHNKLFTEDDFYLLHRDLEVELHNLNYQSPLTNDAIQLIGQAIARHMVVHLTTYMGLFVPVFREPTLN